MVADKVMTLDGRTGAAAERRVVEGKAGAAVPVEEALGFTKADMLAWHLRVLLTPAGEIDQNHPLCQEYSCEVSANGAVTKLKAKMVSKMDSAKQISAMCGWLSADENTVKSTDALTTLIGELRSR